MAIISMIPGGAGETVDLLWSNPNPANNFADQDITLSDTASAYKKLRVTWESGPSQAILADVDYDLTNIADYLGGQGHARIGWSWVNNSNRTFARNMYFRNTDYQLLHVLEAREVHASGDGTGVIIPVAIYGVK